MNFKDLQQRCVIDVKENLKGGSSGGDGHQVYYFKPETFLLDDPEKQRAFRENLLRKVGNIPKPEGISYLGDELHRSMCQAVGDRSTPKATKAMLAEFFKQKQYTLQHMKYKLLCRWAHHALTSEQIEKISPDATFIYGKLEFNLEQAMERLERLDQEDHYDKANPDNRPSTRAELGQGALYVEKFDLPPQSLIREDDIEVYMRGVTYRNKINKVVNKFMSRMKWVPLRNRYDIFEKAIESGISLKQANIKRQTDMLERVTNRVKQIHIMTPQLQTELDQVVSSYYCKQYDSMFLSNVEKTIYSWKANHDQVPGLIADQQLLKLKIQDAAAVHSLTGDIELDHGYSFSYQVTVFFPTYFQKQVIKSQFSIYDAFSVEEDENKQQKRVLTTATRLDMNIFLDVSTTKHTVPTEEAFQSEFRNSDIKILRLKSAAYWIDYVALQPTEPDWHIKQQAIFINDNPIDTLLQQGFNFLDVNDLATVNRINEDNAHLHQENLRKLLKNNPHNLLVQAQVSTIEGDKKVTVDQMQVRNSSNTASNIESHLLPAVQNPKSLEDDKKFAADFESHSNSLRHLPTHLLVSYNTLRFLSSRDAKTRIMYTLNFFRSVQKRLALDLREFATRDRIEGHLQNPFIQSKEANHNIINQSNLAAKSFDIKESGSNSLVEQAPSKKMTVFDEEAIAEMKDMATLRGYKTNGLFSNRIFDTCPSFPKFHATHGEPLVSMGEAEEMDRTREGKSIADRSIKLMGRIDFFEVNEALKEVYVKDDFGIYILYDCVLQDMKFIEQELLKVGSYFLHKSEALLDPEKQVQGNRSYPFKDRLELIDDILKKESEFQFAKVKLIQVYLECYEHVCDPLEQQKLMQVITDIMGRRPRLNLNANYFVDAYDAEVQCLQKQFELIKMLVDMQVSLEKTENKRLQDSLNLSYTLANQYNKNKWKYQDAESLLQAIEKTRQAKEDADQYVKKMQQQKDDSATQDLQKNSVSQSERDKHNPSQNTDQHQTSKISSKRDAIDDGLSSEISLDEAEYYKNDENQFTQLLGLPQVTIETIYQGYREKDKNVIKMMRDHSNFIAVYEGYPEFLTMLTHRSILDKNRLFRPNKWSQETGALDFYDSLDFATKFYAVIQQIQQELYDGLKMWDTTLMTQIDIQVAEFGMEEIRRVQSFMSGTKTEYEGRELLEDEQVMGNSEKLIFYAKEMLADLQSKPKHLVDSFLVSKLDIQTINFFEFPKLKQEHNKYTLRKNGIAGGEYMAIQEKEAITRIAKDRANKGVSEILGGKVGDVLNRRNILVPSMLQTYLNMVELHRLRNELILAASETAILSEIYMKQCELMGVRNSSTQLPEGISFDQYDYSESSDIKLVNFVDHGPSHQDVIALAAREFDPALLSNLNFRNPDSFKLNLFTSGLEEVRAILSYQLLQKHLLIVATRSNCLLTDSYQRAMSELSLIERSKIAVPNSIVHYNEIINRNQDVINLQGVKMQRQSYKQSMSTNCSPVFYNVITKKNQGRTSIAKDYSNYQITAQNKFSVNPYCVLRVMRSFKVKLLVKFVHAISTEVYLDAQKVQALQACQRLRYFNRYFNFEPKKLGLSGEQPVVLKLETSGMLENFPANYAPEHMKEKEDKLSLQTKKKEDIKILNTGSYEILDYAGIPSSVSILQTDAVPLEDLRVFKEKRREVSIKKWGKDYTEELKDQAPELNDPEVHLKQLLMSFSPVEEIDVGITKKSVDDIDLYLKKKVGNSGSTLLDYEEGLYFGDSKYGNMIRYYLTLERILTLEWFIVKLQFPTNEVINMEHALECGLPFWKEDEFDARTITMPKQPEGQVNPRSQQFFFDKIVSMRSKRNIAETVNSMGLTLKSFIAQFLKTKIELRFDYLTQYVEFRYQQIAGSMHKLVQQFYYQKNILAVTGVQSAISKLTKMEHVKFVSLKPNNYSVNMSIVHPLMINIEAGNLIYGSVQYDEIQNFKRCVQPIINEKALEPPQITLFQALYQQDPLRRNFSNQYAGQFNSASSSVAFKSLETALLSLSTKERQYSQSFIVQAKYQANDFMETVFGDTSMASLTNEDVYSLSQLIDAKKFINEGTQALLLRNALICWFENSVMPSDSETYEKFEKNFRQNFFWKQLEQKEELAKKLQMANTFGQIPTQDQLKEMKLKIDRMVNDQNLATQSEVEKRDALVKVLREEFSSLKKKVTLDNYFSTKAEIQVFSNEIEKFLIQASVKTLDSECAALAKCFTLQIPQIQYHIHPFQQFAATFFDQVDPNMHLDISNKVTAVQSLITKMRNRGTEVETLTSGPGMVFTIKDINEILIDFCNTTIKDGEKQFKSRIESFKLMEENYRTLVYQKDQKINSLEHRIKNIGLNLENIIDARLFEKGNQLVYELDSSNRVLSLFKSAMFGLESNLYQTIIGEQQNKFKRQLNQLELKTKKFDDYKRVILNMVNADFAAEQDRIKTILKEMAEQAKHTEKEGTNYKKSAMYPITDALNKNKNVFKDGKDDSHIQHHHHQHHGKSLTGAVVPNNFQHYPECSCYVADPRYPKPTMELAGLDIMTEREARDELARTSILVRKQRIVFRVKEMFMMKKYQDKINLLEKQLTNNSHLWDQLAESQKRERVLKQELLYTQQSHSTSEKIIEKMKEEIKQLDAERGRLAKFKSSKAEKLKELEEKVKKIDLFDNVDGDKLLAALTKKDQQLKDLQLSQANQQSQVEAIQKRRDLEVSKLKKLYVNEQQKTQSIIDKMDQMKLELKMLEANDSSVATIWKKKCLDLFEVCQSMKVENDELRERCKELIEQGITLADAMSVSKSKQTQGEGILPQVNSQNKQNLYANKRGPLASTANTFQRSLGDTPQRQSFKDQHDPYEYLPASAPWGIKSPEVGHVHQPIEKVGYQTHQRGRTQGPGKDIRSILSGSSDKYQVSIQHAKVNKALTKPAQIEYQNAAKTSFQSAVNKRKQLQSQDQYSAQGGFRQITTTETNQIFKLKNAQRLQKIEIVPANFDLQGKTILNPKLQDSYLAVSHQVSHGKNWTSLNVNATTEMQDGITDSNAALSSHRLQDQGITSLLSTQNAAAILKDAPAEIPEEVNHTVSVISEDAGVLQTNKD